MNLLRHCCKSTRWVLVVLESILFPLDVLAAHLGGETNLEEYKMLNEVDKNMQETKQEY